MTPVNNLDELRWYEGCYYSWDRDRGILTISQKQFADALVITFYVTSKQSVPLRAGENEDEGVGNWPLRALVRCLMWLSASTHPEFPHVERAVARYYWFGIHKITFPSSPRASGESVITDGITYVNVRPYCTSLALCLSLCLLQLYTEL